MHSKQDNDFLMVKESLSKLQGVDPKLILHDDVIEIIPFYWNFSLVSNFIPIFISIYFISNETDFENILFDITITGIFIYNAIIQSLSCKTSTIDIKYKSISIAPNILFRIFQKKKIIEFKNIKDINIQPNSFSLVYRRFVIKLNLSDSTDTILVSTKEKENASKISTELLNLIKSGDKIL
jgi:hypothetical protein